MRLLAERQVYTKTLPVTYGNGFSLFMAANESKCKYKGYIET